MFFWITIILVSFVAIMVILSPFVAWGLSTFNLFFTTCPSGNVKFVVKGESIHAIIFDEDEILRLDESSKTKFGLQPAGIKKRKKLPFGLYWIGIPGIFRIHTFSIVKEVENPNGKEPNEWVINNGKHEVDSLRLIIQRSFVFYNIELKDRSVVNVLVTTKFRVINWFIPVFNLKGDFFGNASGILEAAVADILVTKTLQEFLESPKGEVGGILGPLKDDEDTFAKEFIKQVGLELQGIAIGKQDPGDAKLRDAMNAKVLAQKQGEATIATAEAEATALIKKAEAEQTRLVKLGLLKIGAGGTVELVPDARTKAYTDALAQLKELRVLGEGAFPFVDVGGKNAE